VSTPQESLMTDQPDLTDRLAEADQAAADLATAITTARDLPAARRIAEGRRLATEAKTVLSRFADAAVVEATRTASWAEVASAAGTSTDALGKAVKRFNGRKLYRGDPATSTSTTATED
jgi:hypothetical protein